MTEPNRLDEVVGGKYRIVRFLASGGMGSVYEAQHTVVRRRFAVKFLHHELALRRELLARWQLEAEAAGALESEHVAAAMDFGIAADGAPYIVLEYLVGESLEHLLEREGRLPVARAAHVVQQACRGVQAAHASGIVHRDLKPHNLFVCRREDGTDLVKVLDFGVAKLEFMEKSGAATRTGTVLGTPSYMSPEQARGEKNVDHLSDVYALGAILYELLSGKKPHPGESHNAILHHIATQPAIPLAVAMPELPAELVAAVEWALAGAPEKRPASADEFAAALAPWARAEVWPPPKIEPSAPRHAEPSTTLPAPLELASAPASDPAPSHDRPSPVPASGTPQSVELASKRARPASSRRLRPLVAAAGALVTLGTFAVFSLGGHHGNDAEPATSSNSLSSIARVSTTATPASAASPEDSGAVLRARNSPDAARVAVETTAVAQRVPSVPAAGQVVTSRVATTRDRSVHASATAVPNGRSAGRPEVPAESAPGSADTVAEAVRGVSPYRFDSHNPYDPPKR